MKHTPRISAGRQSSPAGESESRHSRATLEPLEDRKLMAVTLSPSADAYVRDGTYASTNYGREQTLVLLRSGTGHFREGHLRFDLTAVNEAVNKAVIRLYGALSGSTGATSMPVSLFATTPATFSDAAITFNNRPTVSGTALATTAVGKYGWYEWDVSGYVQSLKAAGQTTATFALRADVGGGQPQVLINAKEASGNRPQLVVNGVTGTPSPTPTTPTTPPTPTPAPSVADIAVTSLTLFNAGTDTVAGTLISGATLDHSGGKTYSIRADVTSAVKSVKFLVDGKQFRVESSLPFAIAGDNPGPDYLPWQPTAGAHVITVIPYSGTGATGTMGTVVSVTVNVTNTNNTPDPTPEPPPPPPPPPPITPIDGRPGLAAAGGLKVNVGAGKVTLPGGQVINIGATSVNFDAPEIRSDSFATTAPINWYSSLVGHQSWNSAVPLVPRSAFPFRGGLFHGVLPESVVVQSGDGSRTFTKDVDYKLNVEWGQIANIGGRLGTPNGGSVRYSYRYVTQRLDLIQVLPNGQVTVKKGTPAIVNPVLPTADSGAVALAGVFVYTLDGARTSGFTIATSDIYPINPAPAVQPVNPAAITKTLNKLKNGQPVNIAWFGDSITAGEEVKYSTKDRSRTYTGRVVAGLQSRYPTATIRETAAYMGGIAAETSGDWFRNKVLNVHDGGNKVDLLVIALGMNDRGRPDTSAFKAAMNSYIDAAQARGIEVLVVTTMPWNPLVERRWSFLPKAQIAQATRDVASARNVALADVYREFMNLPSRGMPVHALHHNWLHHPGEAGMQLYADTILRFFR
jgi:lysophospholipase L1-like esterase